MNLCCGRTTDGTGQRTDIRGILRGPRGPKNIFFKISLMDNRFSNNHLDDDKININCQQNHCIFKYFFVPLL